MLQIEGANMHLGFLIPYIYVGTEVSYLWQKGDIGDNHSAFDNYTSAVSENISTDTPPMPNQSMTGR